jgi:hypothetical protein
MVACCLVLAMDGVVLGHLRNGFPTFHYMYCSTQG